MSSKGSLHEDRKPRFDAWIGIGGEQVKGRPCWMDDAMRWMGIGGEGGKVGHVGLGRGMTSFPPYTAHVTCQKTGSGSKMSKGVEPEPKVKMSNFLLFYFILHKKGKSA